MRGRSVLTVAVVCIAGCLAATARAGHDRALGSIIQSNNAQFDNGTAMAGSDLYACDILNTDGAGLLRAPSHGSQILLSQSSEVVLAGRTDEARIIVFSGSVSFSAPALSTRIMETPAGILHQPADAPSAGAVTMEGDKQVLVSSLRGDITLDDAGERRIIPAAKTARIAFDRAANASCQESGDDVPSAVRDRRKIGFFIVGGAAAATAGYFGWSELTESPTRPQ